MDVLLAVVAGVIIVIGLIGSVVPVLPGPILCFAGILLFSYTPYAQLSNTFLIAIGLIALFITVLDYFIPAWGTKKFGGSKAGKNGALIGVVAGLFIFPPFGIIIGPFAGAFIGELIHDSEDMTKAFKSATGSLVGFLLGTGLKLMFGFYIIYRFIKELYV